MNSSEISTSASIPLFRVALVLAVGVSAAVNVGKVPAALPALQQAFAMTLVQASFLVSVFQVAGMLFGLFGGVLADRFGARNVMVAGLGLLAAACVLGAVSSSAWMLLLSRAMESAGFLLSVLPGPAMLRRLVGNLRFPTVLGWWGTYMPIGTTVGLIVTPWLIQAGGWPIAWWFAGGAAVGVMLLVLRGLPADPAGQAMPVPALTLARDTIRAPGPWMLAACFGLYAGQFISVFGFLPTVYQSSGIGAGLAGFLTALGVLSNVIGNIVSGALMQRGVSRTRVLGLASAVMILCALLAFAEPLPFGFRYGAVLVLSGVGGLIPGTLFTTVARFAPYPGAVSTATGLMQQGSMVGQFFAPPLVALVASTSGGWQSGSWVIATMAMLNIGVAALIGRHDLRHGGAPALRASSQSG
ncbi:MAG: MFS transporter [Quisquiliibacterium sp.]